MRPEDVNAISKKFEIENIYWFFVWYVQNNNNNHNKNFSMAEETVHIKGTIDIVLFLLTIICLLPIVWNYLSAALVNMKHWSHYMAFAIRGSVCSTTKYQMPRPNLYLTDKNVFLKGNSHRKKTCWYRPLESLNYQYHVKFPSTFWDNTMHYRLRLMVRRP